MLQLFPLGVRLGLSLCQSRLCSYIDGRRKSPSVSLQGFVCVFMLSGYILPIKGDLQPLQGIRQLFFCFLAPGILIQG